MRVVDLLTGMLQAQADTLMRLAGVLGEDALLELLESQEAPEPRQMRPVQGPSVLGEDVYTRLENTVRESGLPKTLEFHLWAYPPYRKWIESASRLDASLSQEEASLAVVSAMDESLEWRNAVLAHLPNGDQLAIHMSAPWIKLRARVLQSVGMRHVG